MFGYAKSVIGSHHIKIGLPCQDSSICVELDSDLLFLAVADGVGSAKKAEFGSLTAIESVSNYIKANIKKSMSSEQMRCVLVDGFEKALNDIIEMSKKDNQPIYEYDTTLTAALFYKGEVIYCHSGDGGIIALKEDGHYISITKKQKDEDGVCVIPLRGGRNAWESNISTGPFVSILLATDGIYNTFYPYLLNGNGDGLYIPLIRYFLDNSDVKPSKKNYLAYFRDKQDFIESDAYAHVHDDKTIAIGIDPTKKPILLSDDYYKEPDWDAFEEEWRKKAYPSMFEKKG